MVELWFCKPVVVGSNPTVGCLSISQIVPSFSYKSYKKLSGRILRRTPYSGAARGAAPLWKFARQIWFEAEGRNPTVGCFRIVWRVMRFDFSKNYRCVADGLGA